VAEFIFAAEAQVTRTIQSADFCGWSLVKRPIEVGKPCHMSWHVTTTMADGKYNDAAAILYWLSICREENAAETGLQQSNKRSLWNREKYYIICTISSDSILTTMPVSQSQLALQKISANFLLGNRSHCMSDDKIGWQKNPPVFMWHDQFCLPILSVNKIGRLVRLT